MFMTSLAHIARGRDRPCSEFLFSFSARPPMTRRRTFGLAFSILLLLPVQATAQKAASSRVIPGSPEAVFLKAAQAIKDGRLEEFARALDPDDLKRFQALLLSLVDIATKKGEVQQLLPIFPGVKSGEELRALAPIPFFITYFNGLMANTPGMKEILAGSKDTILGRVDAKNNTVYIIFRSIATSEGETVDEVKAVALSRSNGRWTMKLDGDLERMVLILKRQFRGEKPESPKMKNLTVETLGRISDKDGTALVPYRVTVPIGDLSFSKLAVFAIKRTDRGYNTVRDGKSPKLAAAIRDKLRQQLSTEGTGSNGSNGQRIGEKHSQEFPAGSPEDVYLKSAEAIKQGNLQEYAKAIYPEDLKRLQTLLLSFIELATKRGEPEQGALRLFVGVKSIEELKSLAPAPFYAALFSRATKASGDLSEALAKNKTMVIGRVDEGNDTTFLIYRTSFGVQAGEPDRVRAIALRRVDGKWKVMLDGEIERKFLTLKHRLESGKQEPANLENLRVETVGRFNDEDGTAYIPYRAIIPAGDSQVTRFGVYPVRKTEQIYGLLTDGKTPEITATIRDMLIRNFAVQQAAERKNQKP